MNEIRKILIGFLVVTMICSIFGSIGAVFLNLVFNAPYAFNGLDIILYVVAGFMVMIFSFIVILMFRSIGHALIGVDD